MKTGTHTQVLVPMTMNFVVSPKSITFTRVFFPMTIGEQINES